MTYCLDLQSLLVRFLFKKYYICIELCYASGGSDHPFSLAIAGLSYFIIIGGAIYALCPQRSSAALIINLQTFQRVSHKMEHPSFIFAEKL